MKCPYCSYFDGWNADEAKTIHGDKGGFYMSPVKMEKDGEKYDRIIAILRACPNCDKVFIEK